jgi:hypothetical protein
MAATNQRLAFAVAFSLVALIKVSQLAAQTQSVTDAKMPRRNWARMKRFGHGDVRAKGDFFSQVRLDRIPHVCLA